jgi:hypothetical protein
MGSKILRVSNLFKKYYRTDECSNITHIDYRPKYAFISPSKEINIQVI